MCLPPVFVVEAKGAGRGSAMTQPSVARSRGGVELGVVLRGLHLVQVGFDLLEVNGELVPEAISPRRHQAVERRIVPLHHLTHRFEERLTMRSKFVVQVVGEFMSKEFIDGAALVAQPVHRLTSPLVAETRRVAVRGLLQDEGSDYQM